MGPNVLRLWELLCGAALLCTCGLCCACCTVAASALLGLVKWWRRLTPRERHALRILLAQRARRLRKRVRAALRLSGLASV